MPIPVAPVSPPAAWQGGKRHLAERLVARIDAVPHDVYAEPFLGMGGVFFRRRLRPRVEVVNDLARDVATFFRVLQRHERALLDEMLRWQLASRAEFERQVRIDPAVLTNLERAARFYYLQRLAYSGKASGRNFGVSPGASSRLNMRALAKHLALIHARLAGVVIECLPFENFMEQYDRRDCLFYLDPPYFGGEADYGKGLFARADFEKMAAILARLKGRFILSINDTPETRRIFAGFALEEVATTYSVGAADRTEPMAELIVSDRAREGDGLARQARLI